MALELRYTIILAQHGLEALAVLAERAVDLVLLDLMMPVLDGEAFVAEARRLGLRVPIILMSAGTDLRLKSQALGAIDFMQKPITLAVLEAKIDQAVAAAILVS